MSKRRNALTAILSVAMAASLFAGCGSSSSAGSASSSAASSSASAAASSSAAEETSSSSAASASAAASSSETVTASSTASTSGGSVEGSLKGVTLTFGTTALFAPFTYYDTDGTTLIGFDIDFEKALQDYLGFELSDTQVMDYSALTTSLSTGKVDFGMAALCATDERKEVMNFTNTYCDSGQSVMINTETSPKEITDIDSLVKGDYKIAVEKGTASHMYCTNAGVPDSRLEVHDTITTAYESLEQGKVDAVIQDTPNANYYCKTTEGTKLAVVGDQFNQGQSPYAIAFSFDVCDKYPGIVDTFNQAIQDLIDNGTYDELSAKWLE
ncbi:MAG: transporter substrate-binding domain-containing protein [Bilifractor sp.]|jgi:glutamine transport system substrate-binding protein